MAEAIILRIVQKARERERRRRRNTVLVAVGCVLIWVAIFLLISRWF